MALNEKTNKRHILMYFDALPPGLPPDVETYPLDFSDKPLTEANERDDIDQVDLPLLNNLETPLFLIFLGGGETGKRLAELYCGRYVEDPSEAVNLFR